MALFKKGIMYLLTCINVITQIHNKHNFAIISKIIMWFTIGLIIFICAIGGMCFCECLSEVPCNNDELIIETDTKSPVTNII